VKVIAAARRKRKWNDDFIVDFILSFKANFDLR